MEEKEMITIKNGDGTTQNVELVTYLVSDDETNKYLVYSKGEVAGDEKDEVIYISKIIASEDTLKMEEIVDDNEWTDVQKLLKKIANAS